MRGCVAWVREDSAAYAIGVALAPGIPQLVELFVSACGCKLPVDASELVAHASAVRRGVLSLGLAANV